MIILSPKLKKSQKLTELWTLKGGILTKKGQFQFFFLELALYFSFFAQNGLILIELGKLTLIQIWEVLRL